MLSIYYIGIVQSFFAALLIWKKPQKALADRVLIVWLMVIGIEMVYSLLNLTIIKILPDLIILPITYGPFLLFYTQAQVVGKRINFKTSWVHFIPFIVLIIVSIFWNGPRNIILNELFHYEFYAIINFINYFLFIASMLWYWILVFKILKVHKAEISKSISYENEKLKLTWVKSIAWWILGGFIVSGMLYILFLIQNIYPFNPIIIYHLGLVIFVFSISYYGIHQPDVISVIQMEQLPKKLQQEYSKEQLERLGIRINKFMMDLKPYLNQELTLNQFCTAIDENQQIISYYLNHYLKKNFFSFINEFRVEESKRLISVSKMNKMTFLAIAYESGFNSKSSFNSIFKKYTGITPTEYQKKC